MTAYPDPPSASDGPNPSSGERSKPLVNVLLFGFPPLLPARQLLAEPVWSRIPHPVPSENPVPALLPVSTPVPDHPVSPPPVLLLPQCSSLLAGKPMLLLRVCFERIDHHPAIRNLSFFIL